MMDVGGCGHVNVLSPGSQPLFVAECDGRITETNDLVLLHWEGGETALYPGQAFPALELSAFPLDEGGTLDDRDEEFREQVREQITLILCDSPGPAVVIRQAEEVDESRWSGASIVRFTQSLSPQGARQIGEGHFDVCNRRHDNAALVFGEEIRLLAGVYSFEEWVHVFANVAAHEIGHTLGFGHIDRETFFTSEAGRGLLVELMLEGHTMTELRGEQRFLLDQTYCPNTGAISKGAKDTPVYVCEAAE